MQTCLGPSIYLLAHDPRIFLSSIGYKKECTTGGRAVSHDMNTHETPPHLPVPAAPPTKPPAPHHALSPSSSTGHSPVRYRMKDMPDAMRPREIFEKRGAEHVDDAVLLALILRTGIPGQNVMKLAEAMMCKYGTLGHMARLPVHVLMEDWKGHGLGKVKAQMLKAALEMARRVASHTQDYQTISTPLDAARVLQPLIRNEDVESFWVLVLNTRNLLTAPPIRITQGILNASLVHPREVFKQVVGRSPAFIIVGHNHPSGDPTPSHEDVKVTRELVASGRILGIPVHDHIVVCPTNRDNQPVYSSLRELGLVSFES